MCNLQRGESGRPTHVMGPGEGDIINSVDRATVIVNTPLTVGTYGLTVSQRTALNNSQPWHFDREGCISTIYGQEFSFENVLFLVWSTRSLY